MLSLYKSLAKIRKLRPAFQTNTLQYAIVNENIFSVVRSPAADESRSPSYLVAINFGKSEASDWWLRQRTSDQWGCAKCWCGRGWNQFGEWTRNGEHVDLKCVELESGEALVIRIGNAENIKTELWRCKRNSDLEVMNN